MNMNKALFLVAVTASLHLCNSSKNCCLDQHLELNVTRDSELLIGDDFNITCSVNKIWHNCSQDGHHYDCTYDCSDPPIDGIHVWICRQNKTTVEDMKCLLDYKHKPLKYAKSSRKATAFSLPYSIQHGQENDSDTYFCLASSGDPCFQYYTSNSSIKVTFKDGASPSNVSVTMYPPYNATYKIMEGDPVNLTCSADGYPTTYTYAWYRNEVKMHHFGPYLAFPKIQKSNHGRYQCNVTNSQGSNMSDPINVKVHSKGDSFWTWRNILIVSLVGGAALTLLIILIIIYRHHRPHTPPVASQDSLHEPLQPTEIRGSNNTIIRPYARVVNVFGGFFHQQTHFDNGATSPEIVLIYYNHPADKDHAQQIKDRLSAQNSNLALTLWGDCIDEATETLKNLFAWLQRCRYIIIVRTESFVESHQSMFENAVTSFEPDYWDIMKSNVFIVSHTSQELPECLRDGPINMEFKDDQQFWGELLRDVTQATNGLRPTDIMNININSPRDA